MNRYRLEPPWFEEGDLVMVSAHYQEAEAKAFKLQFSGPAEVLERLGSENGENLPRDDTMLAKSQTYRVQFLSDGKIDEYHVRCLVPYYTEVDTDAQQAAHRLIRHQRPHLEDAGVVVGTDMLQADHIRAHRIRLTTRNRRIPEFLVRWQGFTSQDDSWVLLENFAQPQLVTDYLSQKGLTLDDTTRWTVWKEKRERRTRKKGVSIKLVRVA